jgi:hypothetical protein
MATAGPNEIQPNGIYDKERLVVVFGTRARVDRLLRVGKPVPFRKGQWRGNRIIEAIERMEAAWLDEMNKRKAGNKKGTKETDRATQKKTQRVVIRHEKRADD